MVRREDHEETLPREFPNHFADVDGMSCALPNIDT